MGRGIGTLGEGGGTASPRHAPATPNFGFSSDFGHFILWKVMQTFKNVKKLKNREILGDHPLTLRVGGTRPPRPPVVQMLVLIHLFALAFVQ